MTTAANLEEMANEVFSSTDGNSSCVPSDDALHNSGAQAERSPSFQPNGVSLLGTQGSLPTQQFSALQQQIAVNPQLAAAVAQHHHALLQQQQQYRQNHLQQQQMGFVKKPPEEEKMASSSLPLQTHDSALKSAGHNNDENVLRRQQQTQAVHHTSGNQISGSFSEDRVGKHFDDSDSDFSSEEPHEKPQTFSCGMCNQEDTDEMVSCDACKKWFHYECQNFDPSTPETKKWFCENCDYLRNPLGFSEKRKPQKPKAPNTKKKKLND